jgi:5-methyltetrahydropteroyltriglutamate--homocysteine methyltransferase
MNANLAQQLRQHHRPLFRADHVGSLLRPPALLKAREQFAAGQIPAAALRRIEDAAVRDAVRLQEKVGLQSITDGEFRRQTWHMDFLYQIGGVSKAPGNLTVKFCNEHSQLQFTPEQPRVTSKLKLAKCLFGEDFSFLRSVTKGTPKVTIPSPSMMHYRGGRAAIDPAVYPDMEEFWEDLAEVYACELDALATLGCAYLQLDDTSLAYLNDPAQRKYVDEIGGDGELQHNTYIKLINAALKRKPDGMAVYIHLCRGNYRSSWAATGGYDYVADALFNELNVDGYFLEYDDSRSGTFEPLRFVPRGHKTIVLGLVTSKRGELERADDLKRRVDEAAKFVPLEQLALSPQCGFASTWHGNALSAEEQNAKLELVVRTAREIWGEDF